MDLTNILVSILALLGGLPVVLKAIAALIPGDRDDKILGPVIATLDSARNLLSPVSKSK